MKRKSKLMLGISALLVAAGAVGVTGTFAWFNQTTGVTVTEAGPSGTITTANSTLSALDITATWSLQDLSNISLSRNSEEPGTSGTLTTYVRNAAGNMVAATAGKLYGKATITLSKDSGSSLIPYTGNWHAVVSVTNATDANGHTVTLGTAASSTATFTDAVSNKVNVPFKIDTSGNFTTSAVVVYVRIDGGEGDVGSSIASHDFSATISATIAAEEAASRDGDYSA